MNPNNRTTCQSCPSGRASSLGASTCSVCKPGTFASTSGKAECLECSLVEGEAYTSTPGAATCSVCAVGYYQSDDTDMTCSLCSEAMVCGIEGIKISSVSLEPEYFRFDRTSTEIFLCPFGKAACPGGNSTGDRSCGVGFTGPLCSAWYVYVG